MEGTTMRRTRGHPNSRAGQENSSGDQACQKSEKQIALVCDDDDDDDDASLAGNVSRETSKFEKPENKIGVATDTPRTDTPPIPKHTIAEVDVSIATDRKPRIQPYVPNDQLDERQERFVKEYQVDLNVTKAAIRSGYEEAKAKASGERNMKQIKVLTAMALERAAIMLRTEATTDSVITGLHAEANFFGEGASHSARISALNSLGKHFGMFVDLSLTKSEVTITINREDANL